MHKDRTMSPEWLFMKNQIFLGVLGSLVVPRPEIQNLLSTLSDAGVRFVYFSPRNMRRQKELASQMGTCWSCFAVLRTASFFSSSFAPKALMWLGTAPFLSGLWNRAQTILIEW